MKARYIFLNGQKFIFKKQFVQIKKHNHAYSLMESNFEDAPIEEWTKCKQEKSFLTQEDRGWVPK